MGYLYFIRFSNDSVKVGMSSSKSRLESRLKDHKADAEKFNFSASRIYTVRVSKVRGTESKLVKMVALRSSEKTRREYFHTVSRAAEIDIVRAFRMKQVEGLPVGAWEFLSLFRRMWFAIPPVNPKRKEGLVDRIADILNGAIVMPVFILILL